MRGLRVLPFLHKGEWAMYKTIMIGIDESYTKTGISVVADGRQHILKVSSTRFKGCKNKSDKRRVIRGILNKLIPICQLRASQVVIILERIRTFTGGSHLRPKYLISTGALVATIVDTAYDYGVKCFSVDTRAWKSKIVGTSKHKDPDNPKAETIQFVLSLGITSIISKNRKGITVYDDDACDSLCMALYGFLPKNKRNLRLEE